MRLSTYFLLIPAVIIAAALAVANRESVALSFDPFSDTHPALVLDMPLFLLLFLTLLLGVVLGGVAMAFSLRRRHVRPEPPHERVDSKALVAVEPHDRHAA